MKTAASSGKKTIFNVIMVVAIIAIILAGIMIAGNLQGWFDQAGEAAVSADGTLPEDGTVTAQNKIGSANIEREGIAYSLKDGTRLKDGDIIETLNGSSVDLVFGENQVSFNQNSEAAVRIGEEGEVTVELSSGEVFAALGEPFRMKLVETDTDVSAEEGAFSASAPAGTASVYVFENQAQVGKDVVGAGTAASILADGVHTAELTIQSLNDFNIEKIRTANSSRTLCFTNGQLDQLVSDREAEMRAAQEAQQLEEQKEQQIDEQRQANKENPGQAGNGSGGTASGSSKEAGTGSSSSGGASAGGNSSGTTSGGSSSGTASVSPKCTIEIRCDTILNNMGDLEEGKNKYVPSNGTILARSSLEFSEGETVFDVLKRACSLAGIQLEYSWTPLYDSYYVEGINNLYEFDCGNESGWMYQVNGWYPNYGCSSYTLKDGDTIVWRYTCKGYGADIGGGMS